jgi:hypothetical protein
MLCDWWSPNEFYTIGHTCRRDTLSVIIFTVIIFSKNNSDIKTIIMRRRLQVTFWLLAKTRFLSGYMVTVNVLMSMIHEVLEEKLVALKIKCKIACKFIKCGFINGISALGCVRIYNQSSSRHHLLIKIINLAAARAALVKLSLVSALHSESGKLRLITHH